MNNLSNRQEGKKRFFIHKNCNNVARNVSSIELYNLLHVKSSTVCSKKKCNHDNSGDYLQPCTHIVDYSRIVIQRCQNKGCMCKPFVGGVPKCQLNDEATTSYGKEEGLQPNTKNERSQTTKPIEPYISESETSAPSKSRISQSEESQDDKTPVTQSETFDHSKEEREMVDSSTLSNGKTPNGKTANSTVSNSKASNGKTTKSEGQITDSPCHCKKPKPKAIKYKSMCKPNPCQPCPEDRKYCVPANFEQMLEEAGDKEIQYLQCKNWNSCTCDKYDTEDGLKRGLKLPGNNICVQRPVEAKPKEEKKPKKEKKQPAETSSSYETCCFCCKRKTTKKGSEKSIQTQNTKRKYTNKTCQKGTSNTCCACPPPSTTDPEPVGAPEKVKSIFICSRCGRIYNNSCKKCPRSSCTKNTFILPTGPRTSLTTDQTETLRTLIKLEAKQNFRQIDNILQELTEQKNEIKKLVNMYQSISNVEKTKNVRINDVAQNDLQNTQTVYICEGCELDMNRNILRAIKTNTERKQHFDEDCFDTDDWNSYEAPDNKKNLKNMMNKRKRAPINMEKEIQTKNLTDKVIQTTHRDQNVGIRKNDFRENKQQKTKRDSEPSSKTNAKLQTEQLNHLKKDTIEQEKPYVEEFSKISSETQSNDCSFISWCKKSLTSLKQKRSKDILKHKCQRLQNKYKECKKSLTDLKEDQSKDGLVCKYLQDKINECQKSITSLKNKQTRGGQKWNCQYLQNKMAQYKESVKEAKKKKSIMDSCTNYCK